MIFQSKLPGVEIADLEPRSAEMGGVEIIMSIRAMHVLFTFQLWYFG